MKHFVATFYRPARGGPEAERRKLSAASLTAARRAAREIARQQEWRLIDVAAGEDQESN